jgi:general secretion pathway protein D
MRSMIRRTMSIVILLVIMGSPALFAEKIKELHFYNQPITDILLALGGIGKKSIVPDETIFGIASFSFIDIEWEDALNVFLQTYKMYLKIENGIYYVSRVRVDYNADLEVITQIDAEDVALNLILKEISKIIKKTILTDTIPVTTLSVHQKNIKVKALLELLIKPIEDTHKLVVYPDYYHVMMLATPTPPPTAKGEFPVVPGIKKDEKGFYSINVSRKRFFELLENIFGIERAEYQLLFQRDTMIDTTLRFSNKTFEELLRILCEHGNADFKRVNNIYYIFEIAQRDILKKLKDTIVIELRYLTAQDLQRLLPPDLGSSRFYRIDTNNNMVILNGSIDEIKPIAEFIRNIDMPMTGTQYYRYDLNFIRSQNLQSLLPDEYKFIKIAQIPDTNSVIIPLTAERKVLLDKFMATIDKPPPAAEIKLKYIKSEDLVKNPPPSISKEDIIITQDPSIIFLKGSPDKQIAFAKDLAIFDQPVPQIAYHVFAISYSDIESMDWQKGETTRVTYRATSNEEATAPFSGSIGNLLSVNFDIPWVLGGTWAVYLNWALSTDKAKVITDTTLYALSGEKVNLSDTEVYRYIVPETSTVTGTTEVTTTGPTRSIETGFKITIEGWASGDGMITMNVDVTISSQGSAGEQEGELGTTFDKIISTTSRTSSGDPIKIGGLIRENTRSTIEKLPLLGDIPILGLLFQRRTDSTTKSEIVVYILPHIIYTKEELADTGRRLKKLYIRHFHAREGT